MVGRIVGLISCIMCAVPFFIIGIYDKDSREPINFWAGDTTLKSKVKDVKSYNQEMAVLYRRCAWAFILAGVLIMIAPVAGMVLLGLECTAGIYVVFVCYKRILGRYT